MGEAGVLVLPGDAPAPRNWSDKPHREGRPRPGPIRCWAVRVWEVDPPPGQDPVEWVILTDEPAADLASVARVASWYACRWLVEEYHKCLKTGCRIEQRQLREGARLERLTGVLAVVAVRLLQLKHQARLEPEAPAEGVVPERYVKTMRARLDSRAPTEAYRLPVLCETAKMGGFWLGAGDGEPGWITLWRGWHELELLTAGFELGRKRGEDVGKDKRVPGEGSCRGRALALDMRASTRFAPTTPRPWPARHRRSCADRPSPSPAAA